MHKIKFGIIGYGNIGKRHAQHIQHHAEAELVAICDVPGFSFNQDELSDIATYDSISSFLAQTELDVVNVCTPNYLHAEHSILALQQGKHVVCEKPMALSATDCNRMIAAAEASNKTIFVVKQNRYNEPVQELKRMIDQGILGKILMVQVNCFWNRNDYYYQESSWRGKKDQDGGCLFTQFSHFTDILFYLFGEMKDVKGSIANLHHPAIEIEDSGSFVMTSQQGAMVNFNFTTCSFEKNMEGSFTVFGELGTVKIGGQYLNTIEYQHVHNYTIPELTHYVKPNDYGKYQGSMSNHDKIIQNVIDTLKGKDSVMTNAQEGKKVVELIESMYKATQPTK